MSEDFVTYELAVKLKEKGFKEQCIAYYWEKINEHTPSFVVEDNMPEDGLSILDLLSNHNQAEWSPFIDAPTISQVLKWLRKDKKVFIEKSITTSGYYPTVYSNIDLTFENKTTYYQEYVGATYKDYNKCVLEAIEYVIDNLI